MERENRNHGNQEKGKEEKEALREVSAKQQTGDAEASPKFFAQKIPPCHSERRNAIRLRIALRSRRTPARAIMLSRFEGFPVAQEIPLPRPSVSIGVL
jgi:hypothetical protein